MRRSRFRSVISFHAGLILCSSLFVSSRDASAAPQATSQRNGQPQSRTQKLSNPLNDLLKDAQRDIDAGNFEAAIAPLQKFITEQPDVAWAHFQLGYVFTALRRPPEARPEYERAIALDPKMAEAYLNLGLLLTESEPAAAVAPLRKAVELLPAQSRPRILLATAQERSEDLPGAVESLEAAIRLDPGDIDTTLHLAILYFNAKRYADAEPKFRTVLDAKPESVQAARGLAESLEAQKKPEAADAWRKYVALQPTDPAVRGRIIHSLVEQQKYDEALAELNRLEEGKTPTSDSLRLRADILIAQKKTDDAIVTLKQALALTPNDLQLITGLGRLYMEKRDFVSAEKTFKAALQLDPKNLAAWKNLSSTYYLGGNCPAALSTLDVIAKQEAPSAATWFLRGLCYDTLHQPKPALEAYQKFLELDEGKNPDQVWQAKERSKVLKHLLEEKRR
jgi:superkiller protein 3